MIKGGRAVRSPVSLHLASYELFMAPPSKSYATCVDELQEVAERRPEDDVPWAEFLDWANEFRPLMVSLVRILACCPFADSCC